MSSSGEALKTLEFTYNQLVDYIEREDKQLELGYTSSRRLKDMELFSILDEELEDSDILVEAGCSRGYTTEILDSRYDAKVMGFDYFPRWEEYCFIDNNEPTKLQVLEPVLPFQEDSIDFLLALNSTGVIAQERMVRKVGEKIVQESEADLEESNPAKVYTENYIDSILEEVCRVVDEEEGKYMISNHLGFNGGTQNILMAKTKENNLRVEQINMDVVTERDLGWLRNDRVEVPEQYRPEELQR